jgi:hypothetical protein
MTIYALIVIWLSSTEDSIEMGLTDAASFQTQQIHRHPFEYWEVTCIDYFLLPPSANSLKYLRIEIKGMG